MDKAFAARRRRDLIIAAVLAGLAALAPLLIKDVYVQNILILTLMYAALSQSWNILSGYCGQISLGHALYFGIGAYTTELLFTKFGVLPWFGMLAGGVIAAIIAMGLGYPFFRLRGHYFVIATIVIAEIGLLLFQNWEWAGAAMGITVPVRGDSWLKFQFMRSKLPYFYFALVLCSLAWFVTWWLEDSKWGFWWRAVKDNPEAAESLGVVVFNSKMGAAAVSAFLVAIGGAFYAQFLAYIDPESVMGFQFSLLMALPAVLGGIGTLWGPVLGAAILIPMTELTRSYIGGSGRGCRPHRLWRADRCDLAGPAARLGEPVLPFEGKRSHAMTALLETRGVWQRFGGLVANSDVSISVGRGEIVGLIGPNGAGKSTLFNLIAGVLPPTQGSIWFDGEDVTNMPAAERCQRGVGRTFQVVKSFETMTVIDNVIVGALVRNTVMREARRKAHEVLEFTGLAARADVLASDLVPAEKRRLEVARALATEPKLLLLDEVLTGLTPTEAQTGVALVRKVRDAGITVLMVEHVMEIVMPLVDRAIVLDLGKVLVEGKPSDVVRDPKVISAYLGDRHAVGA
ncbi:ABC-type branched-subunit amino acid transport system ATPase component/ABC-type branched-subunit amino acid transport system permease subunit [Bradyrhizobium sp. i1.7.7]